MRLNKAAVSLFITFSCCTTNIGLAQHQDRVALKALGSDQRKLPVDPEVATGKLPNGLTYYIRHNNKPEHKVELRLVVRAGSLMETDHERGIAHFVEHMGFRGLAHFP